MAVIHVLDKHTAELIAAGGSGGTSGLRRERADGKLH